MNRQRVLAKKDSTLEHLYRMGHFNKQKLVQVKTIGIDIGYDSPYLVRRYIWGREGELA